MIKARYVWYSSIGFVIIAGFLSYDIIKKQFLDDPVDIIDIIPQVEYIMSDMNRLADS